MRMIIVAAGRSCLLGTVLVCLLSGMAGSNTLASESSTAAGPLPYDPDPHHLWNRLHQALFVRTDSNGRKFGSDQLDPLLFYETKHLVAGESHKEAIKLLDEFLAQRAERLIDDPLKRAILQHDLWAVFDWSAQPWNRDQARRELQPRLARIIQRLALSRQQIEALPDNYTAAIKSKAYLPQFDPKKPDTAFLPLDLFEPDGPWVCLAPLFGGNPTARTHAEFTEGRSAFLVFLRLPEGRQATLDYLKALRAHPKPWTLEPPFRQANTGLAFDLGQVVLAEDLPQLPVDTQVALVRQPLLFNDKGELCPTPLTESVQLRVYRRVREGKFWPAENAQEPQSVFEFQFRRAELFAGKAGGLHAVDPDEQELQMFPFARQFDPFDAPRSPLAARFPRTLTTCLECHTQPGIQSVLTFRRPFGGPQDAPSFPTFLMESDPSSERGRVIRWKMRRHDWGLLQGLLQGNATPPQHRD